MSREAANNGNAPQHCAQHATERELSAAPKTGAADGRPAGNIAAVLPQLLSTPSWQVVCASTECPSGMCKHRVPQWYVQAQSAPVVCASTECPSDALNRNRRQTTYTPGQSGRAC
eukprot:363712-Chlamydomonas_euryale.AAC.15